MRLQVKAHNGTVNDTVRAYAEKRLAKLERRLYDQTVVEVTLSRAHNPSIRDDHSAEAVVYTKGPNIVASESTETYEAAIDRLADKHERRRAVQRKPVEAPVPEELLEQEAPPGTQDEAAA